MLLALVVLTECLTLVESDDSVDTSDGFTDVVAGGKEHNISTARNNEFKGD